MFWGWEHVTYVLCGRSIIEDWMDTPMCDRHSSSVAFQNEFICTYWSVKALLLLMKKCIFVVLMLSHAWLYTYIYASAFTAMEGLIEKRLTTRCLKLYTTMFRHDYPNLAQGELDFIVRLMSHILCRAAGCILVTISHWLLYRNRGIVATKRLVCTWVWKLGLRLQWYVWAVLVLCRSLQPCKRCWMIMWHVWQVCQLILDSVLLDTYNFEFPIWTTYGISVYATIMNFLLFKTTWALSVGTWSKYSVNYISLFEMSNLQPNTIKILNETFTYWVLWSLSLALFFQANSLDSYLYNHTLNYMCPISLIGMSVCYLVVKSYSPAGDRGLFT